MNAVLPAGIESYLKEAGFSPTEMLILRKLVEEDSFTLRELASKTGKSTGVLDQAMKKLLNKKIARKEVINNQPRYSIDSLDAVVRWMEADRKQRKEMIDRKHQNFESFIASLKHDKNRPDMEYFQRLDGIEKAYMKLLEPGEELLTFLPAITEEDDPLRAFRVEYFRRRQVRKIFQRILTPDTPLARRFQSRDAFEYRKTLLVPEAELSEVFEKTIVDGTIACINFKDQSACFLKYPDLAASERAQFESLWNRQLHNEKQSKNQVASIPEAIPMKTRMLSTVREFLLGPKSIAAFAVFTFLAIAVTFGLYKNNESINFQRMQDKVVAIATTGAMQIDTSDLDQLRLKEDYLKPEWTKVVNILKDIRVRNTDILYVYIFRKSMSDSELEFVSDSHSLNPFANTDNDPTNDEDMNVDGKIDGSPTGGDYQTWPGQPYPTALLPLATFESFDGITASKFYEDQWGKVVTGYAPIKNQDGQTIAVLAVDIKADKLQDLTNKTFFPLISFLILFVCFVVARVVVY